MRTRKAFIEVSAALSAMALVMCCAAPVLAGTQYGITDLGPVFASGLNNAGQVVGGSDAWYSPGSTLSETTLAGGSSYAAAINGDGLIVGSVNSTYAAIWTSASALTPTLITPGQPAGASSYANAVNTVSGVDTVVGNYITPAANSYAFSYTQAGGPARLNNATTIGEGWVLQTADGINASGLITGIGSYRGTANEIFLLNPVTNVVTDIGNAGLAGVSSGINNSGEVVGAIDTQNINAYTDNTSAFSWTSGGGLQTLGVLDGYSQANAVNSEGVIVGFAGSTYSDGMPQAVIFSASGQPIPLSSLIPADSGWTELNWAVGINDNGQIAGSGLYNGVQQAFLLDPVPEPVSMIFFGTGLIGVVGYVARRRMQTR
jgi:uncharacterized membrane protein